MPDTAFWPVNQAYLQIARQRLYERTDIFWILGASCTGKSTICQTLAADGRVRVYDMDSQIYGGYMAAYSPERHPACMAWFGAENPLAWALALEWAAFDQLNRATNAEFLDLLAHDVQQNYPPDPQGRPLLVDGGFTHPSILAQVAPPTQICCITAPDAERAHIWETEPARAEMRGWIQALPEPERMWQNFLRDDRGMAAVMAAECNLHGIKLFHRQGGITVADLAEQMAAFCGLHTHLLPEGKIPQAAQTRGKWVGGQIRRICSRPQDAELASGQYDYWVGTATIERAAPYSDFPGITRLQLLLEGDGLILHFQQPEEVIHLATGEQILFDGGRPLAVTLNDRPVSAFNLMLRSSTQAQVRILHLTAGSPEELAGAAYGGDPVDTIFYCAQGAVQVTVDNRLIVLDRGDAYLIPATRQRAELESGGEQMATASAPAVLVMVHVTLPDLPP